MCLTNPLYRYVYLCWKGGQEKNQFITLVLMELFKILKATRMQTLVFLKIPSGLPIILAGFRVAVVLALVGAVVGEFIGGKSGLGSTIIAAQGMMDSSLMFSSFILITVLGIVVYQITVMIEIRILRHFNLGVKI